MAQREIESTEEMAENNAEECKISCQPPTNFSAIKASRWSKQIKSHDDVVSTVFPGYFVGSYTGRHEEEYLLSHPMLNTGYVSQITFHSESSFLQQTAKSWTKHVNPN